MDGFFRLSRTKTLNVQYLRSESQYSDDVASAFGQKQGRFGGNAVDATFTHQGRKWIYALAYRDFSPGFRADYGYVPRVDFRRGGASVDRVFWGNTGDWYTRLSVGMSGFVVYDHEGKLTDGEVELESVYMGPLQSTAVLSLSRSREYYLGRDYDLNQALLYAELKPIGGLRFDLTSVYGGAVDYSNAREARQLMLAPELEFSLGRHIDFNLQQNFQRLAAEGKKIFSANLLQGRFIYNFSVRAFVRLILQ